MCHKIYRDCFFELLVNANENFYTIFYTNICTNAAFRPGRFSRVGKVELF